MQSIETQLNRQYAITATIPCTVTTDNGIHICTVQPGEQQIFTAISKQTLVSDNQAFITLLFNYNNNTENTAAKTYISGIQSKLLLDNHIYDMGELSPEADISALTFSISSTTQTAELWFTVAESVPVIFWPPTAIWADEDPTLIPHTAYRFVMRKEPNGNLIISLAYEYSL